MYRHTRNEALERHRPVLTGGLAGAPARPDGGKYRFQPPPRLGVRKHGDQHLARRRVTLADRGIEIHDGVTLELLDDAFQGLFGEFAAGLTETLLQDLTPEFGILRALFLPNEPADVGFGLAGDDEGLPIRRWLLCFGGDDLDLIAVAKLHAKRNHAPIDLNPDRCIAHFGVYGIGEIDGRRALR